MKAWLLAASCLAAMPAWAQLPGRAPQAADVQRWLGYIPPTPQQLAIAQNTANAAFPSATAMVCSGALTLSFPPAGDVSYDVTLTGPCALAVSGATAGHMQTMEITVRQGAVDGWPLTLPAGVHWKYGMQPVPNTVGGTYDEYFIRTKDGGYTLTGSY